MAKAVFETLRLDGDLLDFVVLNFLNLSLVGVLVFLVLLLAAARGAAVVVAFRLLGLLGFLGVLFLLLTFFPT